MRQPHPNPTSDLKQGGDHNAVPWNTSAAKKRFSRQLYFSLCAIPPGASDLPQADFCTEGDSSGSSNSGNRQPGPIAGPARAPVASRRFPIVCVGGSSGGLDAYIRLLKNLPADMGVAIAIVNHVTGTPTHLHEVLPRFTQMPVELITDRLTIRPNHVYIIPSNRDLHVQIGEFRLRPISKPRGWPDVITVFLRSLAQHWDGKLIAVIVSGYDGDGAAALCAIKDIGGVTIAQKPDSAIQPDMPESAIGTGYIDFVLSPEEIAVEIVRIAGDFAEPTLA
jgi:chemotaxis response regulator CheB